MDGEALVTEGTAHVRVRRRSTGSLCRRCVQVETCDLTTRRITSMSGTVSTSYAPIPTSARCGEKLFQVIAVQIGATKDEALVHFQLVYELWFVCQI